MSYFGSRAMSRSLLWRMGHRRDSPTTTSALQVAADAERGRIAAPSLGRSMSDRGYRRCFRNGLFVRQQRCLLAPVRHLLVLDDSPEQEENQGNGEDREADDLLLGAAVDGPAAGDLEPADTDDAEDDEGRKQHSGDRHPDGRELDRSRPVRAVPPQQDERGNGEGVGEYVTDVARDENAEQVPHEEDEQDVDAHVERHRV